MIQKPNCPFSRREPTEVATSAEASAVTPSRALVVRFSRILRLFIDIDLTSPIWEVRLAASPFYFTRRLRTVREHDCNRKIHKAWNKT